MGKRSHDVIFIPMDVSYNTRTHNVTLFSAA